MPTKDLSAANWRKSSYSNGNGGNNCVEVAQLDTTVALRDSKDPNGPALLFASTDWEAFVGRTKHGAFDRAN